MGKVNARLRAETLRVWLEDVKKGKKQTTTPNAPIAHEPVKFRKYNGR
jgi:hypothetical protein